MALDTRELIDELAELESELDDEDSLDEDEIERMRERRSAISDLLDEIGGEARYGVQLIPEDEFEDHARELAEDIGAYDASTATWPLTCIDWEQAASELQQDYTSITFDGIDYYYRA